MKLSNETLALLKNFASINTNIMFRPGSTISTMSSVKTVFAVAKVAETFPKEVAIYDLNSLLSLLTLMENQEIEFNDNSLSITKDQGKFEYFYSRPEIIVAPPAGKSIEFDNHFQFKLTAEDVQIINKAAAITSAPHIFITSKNQSVTISVADRKNKTANSYTKQVGTCMVDFDVFIGVELFKIIPDAYTVTVSKKKLIHFKHHSKDLEYWLACDPESVV